MKGKHRTPDRRKRDVETSEYVAFLERIIDGYGNRVGEDPAALAHLRDIEAKLRDAVNRGIFTSNRTGRRPYGINEIAAILGITKQSIWHRVKLGEVIYAQREAVRATGAAVIRLADVRRTRAAMLAQAGVEDKTGSPRELASGS